uniref:Uncharacterized protein LOC104216128 n=1 Tax=Nicotiana sylvestris TaxID=4096 RepID=A0A1U7VPY1_NICSY
PHIVFNLSRALTFLVTT